MKILSHRGYWKSESDKNTLENEFHDIAKNNKIDGNNELRDLCLKLEDEMIMLKSAYKEP